MLLFLAADENDTAALISAVREYLAWGSIKEETEGLNLDAQQQRQVRNSLAKSDETIELRLLGSYSWLIVPVQPEPLGEIEFQSNRISGQDNFYQRAERKLRNDGLLINEWSPDILRMELNSYIWGEDKGWEVGLKQLWEYLAQYVYLPRLDNHNVLLNAVKDGVRRFDAPIAYANTKNAEGYHTGVLYQHSGPLYFDDQSLLIHPEHLNEEKEEPVIPLPPDEPGPGKPGPVGEVPEPPKPELTRYYGRVSLDPKTIYKEIDLVVEEVVQRLTSQLGCQVEVSVEIRAQRAEGFDEQTVRTISENGRTLGFDQQEFSER